MLGGLVGKAVGLLVTGVAGAAVYDGVKRIAHGGVARGTAVAVTSWGLRGARAAETGAERARLATADIVSEARERIGEQSTPPGVGGAGHDHSH